MPETDRLLGLIDAGIALSSELSLDDLLRKLAETAAALTGARYAALGVIDCRLTGDSSTPRRRPSRRSVSGPSVRRPMKVCPSGSRHLTA